MISHCSCNTHITQNLSFTLYYSFLKRKQKFYYFNDLFKLIMNIKTSQAYKNIQPFPRRQMTQLVAQFSTPRF